MPTTLKPRHIFFATSCGLSGFAVWLYLTTQIPADSHNPKLVGLFFLSFVTWLASLIGFILFQLKLRRGNREVVYAHIRPSIRQGILIASTIALLLFLKMYDVITWWETILVIAGASLFEIALREHTKRRS